jgi:dTDP-4-dehydrorhamnose reductase
MVLTRKMKYRKALITGATGQLGRGVIDQARKTVSRTLAPDLKAHGIEDANLV